MESDRELLEFAAKAAGYQIHIWGTPGEENCARMDTTVGDRWNPLTDDGDALRLAVKLGLDVCIDTPQEKDAHTHVVGFSGENSDLVDAIEYHGDPYAATRRAIVRAAAEIGKTLG